MLSSIRAKRKMKAFHLPRLFAVVALVELNVSTAFTPLLPATARMVRYPLVPRQTSYQSSSASSIDATILNTNKQTRVEKVEKESRTCAWHRERRRQMLVKYGNQIAPLERDDSSFAIGLPLLVLVNASLVAFSLLSGSLPTWAVVVLALFPGSICSLWQLQILHDVVHGSFLPKHTTTTFGMSHKQWQRWLLFVMSMPSMFGYYLYLHFGHLSHHAHAGDASLAQVFASSDDILEDGDVLFVAHRKQLIGDYGPSLQLFGTTVKLSISKFGFSFWKQDWPVWNATVFALSFSLERILLSINDVVVSLLGCNLFFPNKPLRFHQECALYTRCAVLVRLALYAAAGWKALLFLYLSETLWSIPPHPACAMFVTNHGSTQDDTTGGCIPTSSTYAGAWYSLLTLGTNFHVEHHDFARIPFHKLHLLRKIAPEYYRSTASSSNDNLWSIMNETFARPDFYACMDAGALASSTLDQKES
jgi:fatty acid desaturase